MPRFLFIALCLSGLAPSGWSHAAKDAHPPRYELRLEAARPLLAEVTLHLPADWRGRRVLAKARRDAEPRISAPHCGGERLRRRANGGWSVPRQCRRVTWNARLLQPDRAVLDAKRPASFWNAEAGFWLIAEGASLLRPLGDVRIEEVWLSAQFEDGQTHQRVSRFPGVNEAPFYGVAGRAQSAPFTKGAPSLSVYGERPHLAGEPSLERHFLEIWAEWRRSLLPNGWRDKVTHLDIVWMAPAADAPAGVTGSAGSNAILLQFARNGVDSQAMARRRAALLLTGAHEIFHAVMGARDWPEWAGESLASHFALRAAESVLDEHGCRFLRERFLTPSLQGPALLEAQAAYSAGDAAQAFVFYFKGARFWRALEALLPTGESDTWALAALLRSSDGFAGLDLRDPKAIADYFDPMTGGRANRLINRYLTGETVPDAAE